MVLSKEQQQLIVLLRQQLADLIELEFHALQSDRCTVRIKFLEDIQLHVENIGNTARYVGLSGLAESCDQLAKNFHVVAGDPSQLRSDRLVLLQSWPVLLLVYLQYFGQGSDEGKTVDELLDFLAKPDWPLPLGPADRQQLKATFSQSSITLDLESSLGGGDSQKETLSAFLDTDSGLDQRERSELSVHLIESAEILERAVEQYMIMGDALHIRIAQRAISQIRQYCELRRLQNMVRLMNAAGALMAESSEVRLTDSQGFLLQDFCDCLVHMGDHLAGRAPHPEGIFELIYDLELAVQASAARAGSSADASRSGASDGNNVIPFSLDKLTPDRDGHNSDTDISPAMISRDMVQEAITQHRKGLRDAKSTVTPITDRPLAMVKSNRSIEELRRSLALESLHQPDEGGAIDAEKHQPSPRESTPQEKATQPFGEQTSSTAAQSENRQLDSEAQTGADSTRDGGIPVLQDIYSSSNRLQASGQNQSHEASTTAAANHSEDSDIGQALRGFEPEALISLDAKNLAFSERTSRELLRLTTTAQMAGGEYLHQLHHISKRLQRSHTYQRQLLSVSAKLSKVLEADSDRGDSVSAGAIQGKPMPSKISHARARELNQQIRTLTDRATRQVEGLAQDVSNVRQGLLHQRQVSSAANDLLEQCRCESIVSHIGRFRRCVEEAAALAGKEVNFKIVGAELEVDCLVMGALVDSVRHLLRNAVEHGIETPAERQQAGKPPAGKLLLAFSRVGNKIEVRCRDDGRGLQYHNIQKAARELGVLTADEKLDARCLSRVLTAPGFTTRKTSVAQTAGSGLDLVKQRTKVLRGTLTFASKNGKGFGAKLLLPVQAVTANTLLVAMGDQNLTILAERIEQIVYLEPQRMVALADGGDGYRLDDNTVLALYPLDKYLPIPMPGFDGRYRTILIMRNQQGARCAIKVDTVKASEPQVLRQVAHFDTHIVGLVGETLLADGRVTPVLDLHEIPELNGITTKSVITKPDNQGRPLRALVVDDSATARYSLKKFLVSMGMEVECAKDGHEALTKVQTRPPNLVLVDLNMPRMNGLELSKRLRAIEATRHLPIIMVTASNSEKHRQLASRMGVNICLEKPCHNEDLKLSIDSQIGL